MNERKRAAIWAFAAFVVVTIVATMPVLAQQPSADQINAVAKKLSCPTCTGINVADCPTETCAQWRAKIGELLAEGRGEQEILDYFATRYGDHVLQVPPKRGFFVLVWVLPVIAVLAGLAWLANLMRRWSRRRVAVAAEYPQGADVATASGAGGAADLPLEEEYLKRVQQDLEKLS